MPPSITASNEKLKSKKTTKRKNEEEYIPFDNDEFIEAEDETTKAKKPTKTNIKVTTHNNPVPSTPKKRKTGSTVDFVPVTTPSTYTNSNHNPVKVDFCQSDLANDDSLFKIPFINREYVSQQLAESLLLQKSTQKGILPILSQHFGSGKTALVENFRQVLTRNNISLVGTEENVKSLMQAALVYLDVSIEAPSDKFEDLDLKGIFFENCLERTCDALKQVDATFLDESEKEKLKMSLSVIQNMVCNEEPLYLHQKVVASFKDCGNIFNFFQRWSKNQLFPLLLFFDEFSHLGESVILKFWQRLKLLFGCTNPGKTIRYPGIYIVVAGKSAALAKLGRGFIVSPTPSIHIVLDMLKVEHIAELITELEISPNKSITMKQFLEQEFKIGKHFEFFCKVLHEYSGGIPRLIIKTAFSFVDYWRRTGKAVELSSREKIELVFKSFKTSEILSHVRNLSEIIPLTFEADHPSYSTLKRFFYFATVGIPVEPKANMIDLIYDLNIGVETMLVAEEDVSHQYFRPIVPKFISLSEIEIPEKIQMLQQIFSHGFKESQYVDKGALLEILVRDTIISKIVFLITENKLKGGKWKTIHPCFAKSNLLRDKIVKMDTQYVRYMPKIITSNKAKCHKDSEYFEMDIPWDHTASDQNWKKVKQVFFIGDCLVHPAPKSRSSDFYINLPPDCALAFAVKNYPKTVFSIQMLQQEIDTCFLSTQKGTFSKITLFVFCSGIEHSDLNNYCDRDGCLVLESGVYEFEENNTIKTTQSSFKPVFKKLRNTPNNISEYSPPHHDLKIYIPDDMEVIVLGKQSFDSFFNENDRSLLQRLSTDLPTVQHLESILPNIY
ncbi:predicted protein [Naegleria gruberi]|uniref:Predicted protein n=1 Tax=Naegleria gruberi TaxID=5762 RepID=D2VCJ1_NAEGR|nr:uncharacterized protein NAEGRDRAFT_66589 [Naegleria gruberi]EFC45320.1 predicted protein [Naegleria gruberi]|eukprot:XP_002678064.1 predicted protein [Naegleria gruberi strain NEG-M]